MKADIASVPSQVIRLRKYFHVERCALVQQTRQYRFWMSAMILAELHSEGEKCRALHDFATRIRRWQADGCQPQSFLLTPEEQPMRLLGAAISSG